MAHLKHLSKNQLVHLEPLLIEYSSMYLLERSSDHLLERSAYLECSAVNLECSAAVNLECTERSVYLERSSEQPLGVHGVLGALSVLGALGFGARSSTRRTRWRSAWCTHLECSAVGALECTEHLVYPVS